MDAIALDTDERSIHTLAVESCSYPIKKRTQQFLNKMIVLELRKARVLYKELDLLLRILRILFSVITLALAGYGLITKNFEFGSYMILFLGLSMLVLGIQEIQQNKKQTGWFLIVTFAFSLYVSITSFIGH